MLIRYLSFFAHGERCRNASRLRRGNRVHARTPPRGSAIRADGSPERKDFLDQLGVGQDHAAAAIPFQAERIEDLPRVLSLPGPLHKGRIGAPHDLATRKAADRDDHGLTGTISGASSARRVRGVSSGASAACPGRSGCGRTPGRGPQGRGRSGIGRARGRSLSGRHRLGP
jgi:hypothetical protein